MGQSPSFGAAKVNIFSIDARVKIFFAEIMLIRHLKSICRQYFVLYKGVNPGKIAFRFGTYNRPNKELQLISLRE